MIESGKKEFVAIVDDSQEDITVLSELLVKDAGDFLIIDRFNSGEAFLKDFSAGKYEAIFVDIYMRDLDGIAVVGEIREKDRNVFIALVSSSTEFAMEAYRLHVNRYLEKPLNPEEVEDILVSVLGIPKTRDTIRLGGEDGISIAPDELVCVEQAGHFAVLYFSDNRTMTLRKKLSDLQKAVGDRKNFFHCHKSFIINIVHVTRIDEELFLFETDIGKNVYIRRKDLAKAKHMLTAYHLEMTRNM
ncbi:MAG: LytTR family DNA-binding domain-containing protein [Lachnospiraceae bacterium]|nr:LytTR family DNA-binding domain-containing protein [Lachnospiraceae bacterium]